MNTCPICSIKPPADGWSCPHCCNTQRAVIAYAGIGSRETPVAIAKQMEFIASLFAARGLVLRSGAAKRKANAPIDTDSADLAFERGCRSVNGLKVIRCATGQESALAHAAQYHPNWDACDEYAMCLHARNSLIMMGDYLNDPVKFVICWTNGGKVIGGTGQALRIAAAHNIPVFNLAICSVADVMGAV